MYISVSVGEEAAIKNRALSPGSAFFEIWAKKPQKLTILGTLVRHANCLSYQGVVLNRHLQTIYLVVSTHTKITGSSMLCSS